MYTNYSYTNSTLTLIIMIIFPKYPVCMDWIVTGIYEVILLKCPWSLMVSFPLYISFTCLDFLKLVHVSRSQRTWFPEITFVGTSVCLCMYLCVHPQGY